MAVFTTPFTTPGNYTYDSNKILVSGGVAGLKEDLINVYARYHLNESAGIIAPDDSGNGRSGTLLNMEDGDWVSGKLGNGLIFDGVNETVNLGNIASFEYTQPFSVEFWILFNTTGNYSIIGRNRTVGVPRGWLVYAQTGLIRFYLRNSQTPSRILAVNTINSFHDGSFHHVVVTYNGSGFASGVKIYVDNVDEALTVAADTLGGNTILVPENCYIGSRNNVDLFFLGTLDEAVIYDRVVTAPEVSYRYNSNNGRENFIRFSDKPTIYKTVPHTATISSYTNFLVTDGITEGSKGFQLSDDGGATWYYWNGSTWAVVGVLDYNTAAVINANFSSFSAVSNSIVTKTFLISNGVQDEEIDEIQITYAVNENPSVDAGSNKEVFDNLFLSPFSDCAFSDPDGTVDFARYKIDGEVDIWTNIPQGGYATLLEAVQAFQYQFINTGVITVRLQVEDNLGATNEDSLTVTVKKYAKIVNVKDVVTGDHIYFFVFDPGDGSSAIEVSSPFSYSWDYGNVDLIIEKDFFYRKEQTVFIENEDELTIYLQASAFLNQCIGTAGLLTEGDELSIMAWLQQGGELITSPTSCTVRLFDQNDSLQYTGTTTIHDDGHFVFSQSPSGLPNEGVYHLEITIIAAGVSFVSVVPIGLMERKLISFEGAVHLDVENGSSGTVFPMGTPLYRVNNFADAKIIADTNGLSIISVRGTLVLDANDDISNFTIRGESPHVARIEMSGGLTEKTSFLDIEMYGELNGFIHVDHCHMMELTGVRGHMHKVLIMGPLTLGGGQETIISESTSGVGGLLTPIVDMGGSGQELQVRGMLGGLKLINKTGIEPVSLDFTSGQALIALTCVLGTIVVRGNCDNFVDDSGPNCNVTRPLLQDLHDEALGEWTLNPDDNTLTLYRKDGKLLSIMDLPNTIRTLPSYIGRIPR